MGSRDTRSIGPVVALATEIMQSNAVKVSIAILVIVGRINFGRFDMSEFGNHP